MYEDQIKEIEGLLKELPIVVDTPYRQNLVELKNILEEGAMLRLNKLGVSDNLEQIILYIRNQKNRLLASKEESDKTENVTKVGF